EAYSVLKGITLFEAIEAAEEVGSISRRGLSRLAEFLRLTGELRAFMEEGAGLRSLIEVTWERSGYMGELEAERSIEALGRIENLKELAGVAAEFAERFPDAGLDDFLSRVSLVSEADEYEEEEAAVALMTLHNAKGLEFPVVFMAGMEDGIFPHLRSLGKPEALEEERRLAYVGITRARERLYVTHAERRFLLGSSDYYGASRFLAEVPSDLMHLVGGERAAESRSSSPRYPDPERAAAAWRIGQEIAHERWGPGVITALEGAGERAQATIWFSEVGEKRLVLAYAPIRPVD
ncbi:MAG: 3'-5' exonuclease, partial [Candidatus Methylomirabilales bacterium]